MWWCACAGEEPTGVESAQRRPPMSVGAADAASGEGLPATGPDAAARSPDGPSAPAQLDAADASLAMDTPRAMDASRAMDGSPGADVLPVTDSSGDRSPSPADAANTPADGARESDQAQACNGFSRFWHADTDSTPTVIDGSDGIAIMLDGGLQAVDDEVPEERALKTFPYRPRGWRSSIDHARMFNGELIALGVNGGNLQFSGRPLSSSRGPLPEVLTCATCRFSLAAASPERIFLSQHESMANGLGTELVTRTLTLGADGSAIAEATEADVALVTATEAFAWGGQARLLVARGPQGVQPGVITVFDSALEAQARWPLPDGVTVSALHRHRGMLWMSGAIEASDGTRAWLHVVDAETGEDLGSEPRTFHLGAATAIDVDAAGQIALAGTLQAGDERSASLLVLGGDGSPLSPGPLTPPPRAYEPEQAPRSVAAVAFQTDGSILLDLGRVIVRYCPSFSRGPAARDR